MSAGCKFGIVCRLVVVGAMVLGARVSAQDEGGEDLYSAGSAHVSTRLLPSSNRVRMEDEKFLTVRLIMDEGWHTYWPGMNDTGYGVSIELDPVEGVTFGDPIYPTPERYVAPGDILDHVYEGRMIILVPYTIDEDVEVGTQLNFRVRSEFLVCKDVCLPGKGEGTARVGLIASDLRPIKNFAERRMASMWNARPVDLPEGSVVWEGDRPVVDLEGGSRYQFYPAEDCAGFVDLLRDGDVTGEAFSPELEGEGALRGRLRVTFKDGRVIDYDVDSARP